jgi:hypothetical protein
MLEPDERDAVRGDFAESGETGGQALRDLVGLVVRRQAALFTHLRPWLALVGLVPLGRLLCLVSRRMADSSAIHIWLYANNWDWAFVRDAALRHDLAQYVALLFLEYLTLSCWSWTSGFVLGAVSRGTIQINTVLFCFMVLFGELLGAPRYLGYSVLLHRAREYPGNAAVFALTFYGVMFPLMVQAILVVVPSLSGILQGLRVTRLRPRLRTILWAAAIATLAAIAIQSRGLVAISPYSRPGTWDGWQVRLLQLVVYWPVGYLIASSIGRRWRGKSAPIQPQGDNT